MKRCWKERMKMKWPNGCKIRLVLIGFIVLTISNRVKADFAFGTPTNLGPIVNSTESEYGPNISAGSLAHYFTPSRSGGYGGFDLYVAKRQTLNDDWNSPVNLGSTVNSSANYIRPSISKDGLSLCFGSKRF